MNDELSDRSRAFALKRRSFLVASIAAPVAAFSVPATASLVPRTNVDTNGVWRWADGREVALFGVNYCLPSASAFRFAKQTGQRFEGIVDADFAHFARLGFDALRLCFWGDWENTTADGHLVENEHLFVLDLVLAKARAAGFSCLLSPIITYDAAWPDNLEQNKSGIAGSHKKEELGRDPEAIKAQVRYLRELLSRRNPLTNRRYAEESALIAIEPINEPWHHSADQPGSIRYINALAEAVRSTGFAGPIFHNVTQDMGIAPAVGQADVQGATFAWYPTGLSSHQEVKGNGLLLVDDYPQFKNEALSKRAKLVYEFDAADSMASYMYPAMVRAFRSGGAQLATIFTYDPLAIASSNSEFNSHFLNLIYTPSKAVSALIAATAMRELPRGKTFGSYPQNMRFDGFRVDDREDLSEFVDTTRFYHSNNSRTHPPDPSALKHLAGCGSSPVVEYEGTGAWFLDKAKQGIWRLEIYPDAILTANPFAFRRPKRAFALIVRRSRRLAVRLPDLGEKFVVVSQNGDFSSRAIGGVISLVPGEYTLSRNGDMPEFASRHIAPASLAFDPIILHQPPVSLTADQDWHVKLEVAASTPPMSVLLHLRRAEKFERFALNGGGGFSYTGVVPAKLLPEGFAEYFISVEGSGIAILSPSGDGAQPGDWDFPRRSGHRVPLVAADHALILFDAAVHGDDIYVPYANYVPAPPKVVPGTDGTAALRIEGKSIDKSLHKDVPAQISWNGPLDLQGRDATKFRSAVVRGRSLGSDGPVMVIFIERDGTAWGHLVQFTSEDGAQRIPLSSFRPVQAAMLPRDYPLSINPYWLRTSQGRGGPTDRIRIHDLQAVQLTLGERFLGGARPTVEISTISLSV